MESKSKVKRANLEQENTELRARLAEAEETLEAIRTGAVDALVVTVPEGEQVYSLKGAETPYRLLVEAMNEAAIILDAQGTILYCNGGLAGLARCSAESVIGNALADFVAPEQAARLQQLLAAIPPEGCREEFWLRALDGAGKPMPVQIAVRRLPVVGLEGVAVVITDLTKQKAYEAILHQSKAELEERVRARTVQLHEQREYFRVTLTSIGDAVIAFDTAGQATFVNTVAARLIGWPEDEALGRPVADIFRVINEQTHQPCDDIVARVLREKLTLLLANHTTLITRDGREIPVEDSAAPIFDADGNVVGVVVVFRDVTGKRRAQETIARSEERAQLALRAGRMATWDITLPEGPVVWNEEHYRMLGYAPESVSPGYQAWAARIHPEDRPEITARYQRSLKEDSEYACEYRALWPNGAIRWLEARGLIERNAAGQPARSYGVMLDITERKLAEQKLFEAHERLQALMRALPVGVSFSDDTTCQRITGNPAVLAQFEMTDADNLSASSPDVQTPGRHVRYFRDGQPITDAELPLQRAVAENREISPQELEVRLPSGKRWFAAASGAPLRDQRGRVIGGVAVTVDITAGKQSEDALRQAKEELNQMYVSLERKVRERTHKLQDMIEELEHFSYTITHDMRTPLRAIQGFATLLNDACGASLKAEHREYLELIKSSATRMDHLITDALQYNQAGKQPLPLGPVDAAALLKGIIQSYPSLRPPNARITIAGDIPKVLGSTAGLTQCFANLLVNAVKFVPPGTIPEVRVYAEKREGFVRLWFEDNGIGIPKQAHGKLFQMFQRATRKYEGTGVGLALAKKVTERMGGRIGLESTPGQGSRFWVDLKPAK